MSVRSRKYLEAIGAPSSQQAKHMYILVHLVNQPRELQFFFSEESKSRSCKGMRTLQQRDQSANKRGGALGSAAHGSHAAQHSAADIIKNLRSKDKTGFFDSYVDASVAPGYYQVG